MGVKRAFTQPARWDYGLKIAAFHDTQSTSWDTALDITGRGTAFIWFDPAPGGARRLYVQIRVDGTWVAFGDAITGSDAGMWWKVDFNNSLKIEHKVTNVVDHSRVYVAYHYHGV